MQQVYSREIDFQSGLTGSQVISGTSAVTGGFQAFVVNSNAVISQVLDDKGVDITASKGLSGVTINQGMLISMPKGSWFSSITLTSGSIIAYLK